MLKLAQDGLFCTLKERALPLGSLACGVKAYAVPAMSVVGGVPEMVGGALGGLTGAVTAMLKGASEACPAPSLTVITMFEKLPAAVGVPVSWPVAELKLAQDGLPEIENVSVIPFGALAVGVKL